MLKCDKKNPVKFDKNDIIILPNKANHAIKYFSELPYLANKTNFVQTFRHDSKPFTNNTNKTINLTKFCDNNKTKEMLFSTFILLSLCDVF